LGFWIGTEGEHPATGAWIVLSTVFLMGTHSAFFVPAKYGVMPEIMQPHLLSRGNGMLESLSFLAVILGTVCGGVMSFIFLRREVNIGLVLLGLAILGVLASLFIRRMPAANPTLRFPPYLFGPLIRNLQTLVWSRTLAFAVIGISFFTFIVAFMRATVYMFGESQNPRWDELKTSAIVGTVALGVGLGSPLAGWLSGRKVELGLIPIGAAGMILGCVLAGFTLGYIPGLICCTILIGICTGFYLVPLFTLLQYRAPKSSKGDMIASSNFINVAGAISASLLFWALIASAKSTGLVEKVQQTDDVATGRLKSREFMRGRTVYATIGDVSVGRKPAEDESRLNLPEHLFGDRPAVVPPELHIAPDVSVGDAVKVSHYKLEGVDHYVIRPEGKPIEAHYDSRSLPRFLFLGAALMTLGVLIVLWRRVRDLPGRSLTLIRGLVGPRYILEGLSHVPGDGPVILLIDSNQPDALPAIRAAVDRHVTIFEPKTIDSIQLEQAEKILKRGDVVGVLMSAPAAEALAGTLDGLRIPVRTNGKHLIFADGVSLAAK